MVALGEGWKMGYGNPPPEATKSWRPASSVKRAPQVLLEFWSRGSMNLSKALDFAERCLLSVRVNMGR